MDKMISLKIPEILWQKIREQAKKERRTLTALLVFALEKYLQETK